MKLQQLVLEMLGAAVTMEGTTPMVEAELAVLAVQVQEGAVLLHGMVHLIVIQVAAVLLADFTVQRVDKLVVVMAVITEMLEVMLGAIEAQVVEAQVMQAINLAVRVVLVSVILELKQQLQALGLVQLVLLVGIII